MAVLLPSIPKALAHLATCSDRSRSTLCGVWLWSVLTQRYVGRNGAVGLRQLPAAGLGDGGGAAGIAPQLPDAVSTRVPDLQLKVAVELVEGTNICEWRGKYGDNTKKQVI